MLRVAIVRGLYKPSSSDHVHTCLMCHAVYITVERNVLPTEVFVVAIPIPKTTSRLLHTLLYAQTHTNDARVACSDDDRCVGVPVADELSVTGPSGAVAVDSSTVLTCRVVGTSRTVDARLQWFRGGQEIRNRAGRYMYSSATW